MSKQLSQHAEWLSLIEVSGPFLAEPILKDAFPQGLEKIDSIKKKQFRQTYDEWRETVDSHDVEDNAIKEKIHQEWINWVIKFGLEWDEEEDGDILKHDDAIPEGIQLNVAEHNLTLKPEFAVYANEGEKPYLLLTSYPANTELEGVVKGDNWSTTPAERMVQLCRGVGTRLGIITNGEQWLFIDAPEGGITTYASWYARLWSQEPVTLQAFFSLLNIGTIFNGFEGSKKLTELLDESLKHQDEVTETLGAQVSRAVEVLIQSLDRINNDHNGKLLEGVEPTELYEAGLTLMMRLVFLLCAEERGLLLLGDETYESNYALSTLRLKLRDEAGLHGEEVLSYRKNAWARLLAIFRAVYGGVEHENMRMPALGGSLFDPDRFAFLEGREKGSNWKIEEAKPLPIDNRTVLLFLDAIQLYQGRTLSYRALDVEQIGYVYEGLLEKTVIRASDVTLELFGSKSAKIPWVELKELASAELDGDAEVKILLKERTKSSVGRINSDFNKALSDVQLDKLLSACQNDAELRDRVKPYYHFLRVDAWGNPLLYPKDAFMVTTGTDRRESGAHYTPKSLTESIVQETLEPIVYIGPAEGESRDKWKLKSSEELLELKICDLAMGSGAFLVQVCRWLGERVCEAWLQEELGGKAISAEGDLLNEKSEELLPVDAEERFVIAKRLIAERCIYGVDINPLAVELAKLSIWLVTLSKGRPFGFLDHNLKHGDSLLGLHDLNQLYYLDMKPTRLSDGGGCTKSLFAQQMEESVNEALSIRKALRERPIRDIHDVETMAHLDQKVREKLVLPELVADALVGEVLKAGGKNVDTTVLSIEAGQAFDGGENASINLKRRVIIDLGVNYSNGKLVRKPFHWCLEFPEVFTQGGFDGIVGNPPYLGNSSIRKAFGDSYRKFCVNQLVGGRKGKADFVVFFFAKSILIMKNHGVSGLLTTDSISHGDSKEVGLDYWLRNGIDIFKAYTFEKWLGKASVITHRLHLVKSKWNGDFILNGNTVETISSSLSSIVEIKLNPLSENKNIVFKGTEPGCEGFLISSEKAKSLFNDSIIYNDVIYPYIIARQVNQDLKQGTDRYIINFWDWEYEDLSKYSAAFDLIEENVRPIRSSSNGKWWLFARNRPALYSKIGRGHFYKTKRNLLLAKGDTKNFEKVIVFARGASKYCCFSMIENNMIFGDSLCVVANSKFEVFAVLSSDLHTVWAWSNGGRKTHDLRYIQETVFETFPFPQGVLYGTASELSVLGKDFDHMRRIFMESNGLSLTEFYNLFHAPESIGKDIERIRKKQIEINRSVIKAYDFNDIEPEYGFHKVSYLPEGKNTRFTINEKAREEILYRLAVLNKERYEAESYNLQNNIKPISKSKKINNQQESLF